MKYRLLFFILVSSSCCALAQSVFDRFPASKYNTSENVSYWKNKKPYEGYWQQDVHYKMDVSLDDKTDIITGYEELTYFNNSPDELAFVYFHLYSNAQAKGSYLEDLYKNNNLSIYHGKYQEKGLGTNVDKIEQDGVLLNLEQDNTILKVSLNKPVKSGESITLKIWFKTYFDNGTIRNRMKLFNSFGYKHYDVVHWYPRISVYDKKMGWDTDQHMDHEFYGDYGTYDVAFTFPNNYVLDATGVLINQAEVLPDSLRKALDIKNFANKRWNEAPSEVIKPNGTTKTWMFHAEDVHDFALTADPTYRIGEAEWKGIKCIALAQEPHCAGWRNAATYTAKIIQTNSEDFGMYVYPKMIVADAQDGMEYPMLTLDGGSDPGYRSLFIHEIGHNWFFGMVGSNETYRACLDEGFTQFLTDWTYQKLDGKLMYEGQSPSSYVNKFSVVDESREAQIYGGYIFSAAKGDESTLNTHSDGFNGAIRHGGGYSQVYMKTATMLYNLQYVLGDELFLKAMKNYVEQWKIAHPYIEDFRNSIINYTKVDLNWFFDEWFETYKTIDYSVGKVKKTSTPSEYTITFKREGKMQMPIDFEVLAKDGKKYSFYIPNNWFVKQTEATVLPRWIGWDKVKPTYEAKVVIPSGIKDVVIDPSYRLADVNLLNNNKKCPVSFSFDHRIYNTPNRKKYEVFARPDVWYNNYDGMKIGASIRGNYLNYFHVTDFQIWYNTGLLQNYSGIDTKKYDLISYRFTYKNPINNFIKNASYSVSSRYLDGLHNHSIGMEINDKKGINKIYGFAKVLYRPTKQSLNYLLYPLEWNENSWNNTINVGVDHKYSYKKGTGNINLNLKSSSLGSDYSYATLSMNVINKNTLGKFDFNTRTYFQYGLGSNWAPESQLYLAGANPEEMMENKYTRSSAFIPTSYTGYGADVNHFQYGGGLNLRGYNGYLIPQALASGNYSFVYKGTTGAAINAELEFDRLFKLKTPKLNRWLKLDTYLFADAGTIDYRNDANKMKLTSPRMDAGLGSVLTIKKWGALQMVNPLLIRFDMPLFLSATPSVSPNYWQFRWLLSINKAF